jgi:zinc protease
MILCLLASLAHASDSDLNTEATTHLLDNGVVVILEEDHRTDTIALHIRYGVGGRDEQPGEYGLAHMYEHLMFEGSAHVPTNAFDAWLTAAGGSNNAFTSQDQTAYHMTFPSGALEMALFLETDRIAFLEAGLTEENLRNQQSVVLQERAEGYTEPHGRDIDALIRLQYPEGHPYHVPVIGTVADIEGAPLEAVQDFWTRHYRPQNIVMSLVGHFDSDVALERIQHWMSDVPDRGEPPTRAEFDPSLPLGTANGVIEDDVKDRTLYLSWPTVPAGHLDEPALDLLSYVLQSGRGTRLDDRLYYNSRLANDDGAFSWTRDVGGQFIIYATAPTIPLVKLQKVVDKVVASVIKSPPNETEMSRARRSMKSWILDSLEHPEDRAQLLADCQHQHGTPNCLEAEWQRYSQVTPDDLVRVVETYLTPDRLVTLSVIPRGDDGALDQATTVELP